jgi:predicted NBD/HSP70 family sugar kinase
MTGPSNQRAVRRHNLGVVLRHLVERGPRPRATVALETGLNKSTVSSLVGELMELGLLEERGADHRGTVGRPGLVLSVRDRGVVALGLEVAVDSLAVSAVDLGGGVRHLAREDGDQRGLDPEHVLERVAGLVEAALADVRGQGMRPVGAAVALPGLVESDSGVLLVAPNLGWADVPVADRLRDRLGLSVLADNEANLAALGELWEGAGRGLQDFLHVSGDIGVGAGVVLGGELHRGARGFGGEFGHLTVEPDGRPCACGSRGCLETRVGMEALTAAAGAADAPDLRARARAGDAAALGALAEAGRWLGVAAGSASNLLDLDAIVLGGAWPTLTEWVEETLARELEARVLAPAWAVPRVLASTLGREAAVRGAAEQVLRGVLADPAAIADEGAAA